ncbi:MAG TPA: S41 family peptidase, partial [Candidatus Saccharimonadales bacterium]|nr:S41 family peptidase [Candidatus Saccharimonadales bacterium]
MRPEGHQNTPAKPRKRRIWAKRFVGLLAAGLIFATGFGVGNGNISWSQHDPVSGNLPNKLDYSSVDQLYKSLKDNYDGKLTETQLEDGLKHGLAASTKDPYTVYFTPEEAKEFNEQLNNSFSGIGAQLGQDDNKNLEVIAPIEGLPAQKAGLQAKDLITEINGVSTAGMSVDDAVGKIRGPDGTEVTLQIVRNKSQTFTLTITREDITLPSVKTKILDGNVGYIQIASFSNDTVALARKAAEEFKSKDVSGIIVDVRNDPGGLLDAAVEVTSLWLPEGQTILKEKRGNQVIKTYRATGNDILRGIPTVVLVNGGSASASEILAGALRDN